jgi:hypothetical protein
MQKNYFCEFSMHFYSLKERLFFLGVLAQFVPKGGTAIGSNPVAFLIPCYRVIQSSGQRGGYMWGTTRKTAIIGWEGAHSQTPTE